MPNKLLENEEMLLRQVMEGNEKAFSTLYHAYRDKLYSFLYKIAGSRELTEDLVQDVFLKIWTHRGKLTGIENFNAFLYRMSQNHAINHLRRVAKETLILLQTQQQLQVTVSGTDELMSFHHLRDTLNEIVAKLPPQQKAVYQLSRDQNLKQEEIARQLSISISTVKNHMTQALRAIQQGLGKYYLLLLLTAFLTHMHPIS